MSDRKDYTDKLHAMQSGVAMEMNHTDQPTSAKHLRVGVNAAMSDQAGLVKLLIAKGIITEAEYLDAITEAMSDEVKRYEDKLNARYGGGSTITLA